MYGVSEQLFFNVFVCISDLMPLSVFKPVAACHSAGHTPEHWDRTALSESAEKDGRTTAVLVRTTVGHDELLEPVI